MAPEGMPTADRQEINGVFMSACFRFVEIIVTKYYITPLIVNDRA